MRLSPGLGQCRLTMPNTYSTITVPASLRSDCCSPSLRNAVRLPSGIDVHVHRNTHGARTNLIVSREVRWLAIATGCFTAVAGSLGFGWLFPITPSFLIAGAILQPRFPRVGRGLMLAGALWLSLWVLPYGVAVLGSYSKIDRLATIGIVLVSVLLVTLCDSGSRDRGNEN